MTLESLEEFCVSDSYLYCHHGRPEAVITFHPRLEHLKSNPGMVGRIRYRQNYHGTYEDNNWNGFCHFVEGWMDLPRYSPCFCTMFRYFETPNLVFTAWSLDDNGSLVWYQGQQHIDPTLPKFIIARIRQESFQYMYEVLRSRFNPSVLAPQPYPVLVPSRPQLLDVARPPPLPPRGVSQPTSGVAVDASPQPPPPPPIEEPFYWEHVQLSQLTQLLHRPPPPPPPRDEENEENNVLAILATNNLGVAAFQPDGREW